MAYKVVEELLSVNHWPGRNGHPVEGMFVHVSEGSRSSVTSWFNNPVSEASSQYLVCKDGTRVRYVRDQDTAWANGVMNQPNLQDPFIRKWWEGNINPNRRSISVETERQYTERLTVDQQASLNELAVELHRKFGWPVDGSRIWGHYEVDSVDRPHCPSLTRAEWDRLVQAVGKQLPTTVIQPDINPTSELYDKHTGKYIHESLWQFYRRGGLAAYGRPLAGAYLYSDGWIRQLFENVVLGSKEGKVRVEGLGQAWSAHVRTPWVNWPGVHVLK